MQFQSEIGEPQKPAKITFQIMLNNNKDRLTEIIVASICDRLCENRTCRVKKKIELITNLKNTSYYL